MTCPNKKRSKKILALRLPYHGALRIIFQQPLASIRAAWKLKIYFVEEGNKNRYVMQFIGINVIYGSENCNGSICTDKAFLRDIKIIK